MIKLRRADRINTFFGQFKYNAILRVCIEIYLDLTLVCFINIANVSSLFNGVGHLYQHQPHYYIDGRLDRCAVCCPLSFPPHAQDLPDIQRNASTSISIEIRVIHRRRALLARPERLNKSALLPGFSFPAPSVLGCAGLLLWVANFSDCDDFFP